MPEGAMPEDAAWADPVVVPDDLRDLQAEVDAYHRELRTARRRRRRQHLLGGDGARRWAFPLGVVTGALMLAMLGFLALAIDGGGGRLKPAAAAPLAAPAAAPGQDGGLLPDLRVRLEGGQSVAIRSLRPSLVALVPQHCGCTSVLDHLAAEANEVELRLVVIAPAAPDAEVAALAGQLHGGRLTTAYDDGGHLARAYSAHGLAALVVARDGVVTYVDTQVTPATSLELPLQAALLVGSASDGS